MVIATAVQRVWLSPSRSKARKTTLTPLIKRRDFEVLTMTTFSILGILPTLETKMVDARHMRLRPGRFLNS